MGVLIWEKPKKVESSEEWARNNNADGAPPGMYVSNMSEDDRLKWKAKIVGKTLGYPQVEIRKDSTVIVLSLHGYKYKHYNTRQTDENIKKWAPSRPNDVGRWPTGSPVVHVASAGPLQLTMEEFTDMQCAFDEAFAVLHELEV
jgi:hypothetical protein